MIALYFHQMNSDGFPPHGVFMAGILMHSASYAVHGRTLYQ